MQAEKRKYESARQIERQSNILASAREMLSDVGYAGMTMRVLADKAGVAPATLYNLYGGKDELIFAAVEDLLSELGARAAESREKEGIEAILATAKVGATQTQATPKYAEAMTRALFNAESDDPLIDVLFTRGHPYVTAQLTVAQEKGEIAPEVNVDLVALHLTGQSWSTIILWIMGMLPLQDMIAECQRSQIMTLLGITRGAAKKRLQAKLDELGWEQVSKSKQHKSKDRS
jgi:AcrR family transcriptional regulator